LNNKYLVHLDFSHNNFDSRELTKISEGLNQNHSILGIHMAGNEGSTNALGYIDEHDPDGIEGAEDVGKHAIFTRIKPTLKMGVIKNPAHIKLKAQSNCWICEGWTEFKFNFIPKNKVDTKI
jgi:hypothetical protein